jgi:hypothetical protein
MEEFNKVINNEAIGDSTNKVAPEVFDNTDLNMQVALSQGEPAPGFARVTKRLRNVNSLPIGIANWHSQ